MSSVIATWNGPWGYVLPDGTPLVPGETQREIPEFQANDDPYWSYVAPPQSTVVNSSQGGDK